VNYRKKYELHHNIKLAKDYDVHHIDWNHQNDDIDNLIHIPKLVHVVIHQTGYLNREEINNLVELYNKNTKNANT
jgi:hypothetical protein